MLNVKFQILRLLNEEIDRLERIRKQVYAGRDYEKRKEYEDDLKWCKNALDTLRKEFDVLSEKAYLSKSEKAMAYAYYCKGMTWEEAFREALDMFTVKEMKEYEKTEKEEDEEEERAMKEEQKQNEEEERAVKEEQKQNEEAQKEIKVKQNKYVMRLKKSVIRKIQKYFNYYNHGESKKSKKSNEGKITSSQDN